MKLRRTAVAMWVSLALGTSTVAQASILNTITTEHQPVAMAPAAVIDHLLAHDGQLPSHPVVSLNPLKEGGQVVVVADGTRLDVALPAALGSAFTNTPSYACLGTDVAAEEMLKGRTRTHALTMLKAGVVEGPYVHVIQYNQRDVIDDLTTLAEQGIDLGDESRFRRFMPVFLMLHEWYHTGTHDLRDCRTRSSLDLLYYSEMAADAFAALLTGQVMRGHDVTDQEVAAFLSDVITWRNALGQDACGVPALTHITQPALSAVRNAWLSESPHAVLADAQGLAGAEAVAAKVAAWIYQLTVAEDNRAGASAERIDDMLAFLQTPGHNYDPQFGWLWQMYNSHGNSPLSVRLLDDYLADPTAFQEMPEAQTAAYKAELLSLRGSAESPWQGSVAAVLNTWNQMPEEKRHEVYDRLASAVMDRWHEGVDVKVVFDSVSTSRVNHRLLRR